MRMKTYPLLETVGETGMVPPCDTLVVREMAGTLGFEVKKTLGKGILITEFLD